jgi:hypothetical protein
LNNRGNIPAKNLPFPSFGKEGLEIRKIPPLKKGESKGDLVVIPELQNVIAVAAKGR